MGKFIRAVPLTALQKYAQQPHKMIKKPVISDIA
jgi:hypothetical protein